VSHPLEGRLAAAAPLAPYAALALIIVAVNLALVLWLSSAALGAAGHREREVPLELTTVAEGGAFVRQSAHEVIVVVDSSGTVRAGGRPHSVERLRQRLEQIRAEGGLTAVTVRADARAPYGTVARVLAATRRAGVRDASLLVIKPNLKE
jgi:biopolymer transport protein ExbD